ncbi:hypothetical protein [Paenarthrobacter sp. NPDC057981]|uniref:hypothetical protein n=1 Tax=Paenarthrobacter sp. NPDC057981 TaxID=3346297 RepID=UPI0036DC5330
MLDFIGVTDMINCFTKADLVACGVTLMGVFPFGKAVKALEAFAMLGKILPKAFEFFTKRQAAIKDIFTFSPKKSSNLPNLNPVTQTGTSGMVRKGKWGEEMALVDPAAKKTRVDVPGQNNYRYPDERLNPTDATYPYAYLFPGKPPQKILHDVKNVDVLKPTKQLDDFQTIANSTGEKLMFSVRPGTKLEGWIEAGWRSGDILIMDFKPSLANKGTTHRPAPGQPQLMPPP